MSVDSTDYLERVLGAAIFDLNGLPKDYFTSDEAGDISWVQTIFQALGLRSLLVSSLKLEGFKHAVINSQKYSAIVVRQPSRYISLLIRRDPETPVSDSFLGWVHEFDPNLLRSNSRFRVA